MSVSEAFRGVVGRSVRVGGVGLDTMGSTWSPDAAYVTTTLADGGLFCVAGDLAQNVASVARPVRVVAACPTLPPYAGADHRMDS